MKIIVTGASGFVGRRLCQRLVQRGDRVCALVRDAGQAPAGTEPVVMDLSRAVEASRLPADANALVHLAQSARFREFPAGARDMFEVNLRSLFDLLEYARLAGVRHFVHASSGGIYGHGDTDFSEAEPVTVKSEPLGFYLSSKLAAEILVDNYAPLFPVATLRLFFAFGPGQQKDRLIPRLINNVRAGQPVTLDGENGLLINPIFVDDAVEAIVRTLDFPQTIKLNVGGAEVMPLRAIANTIGECVGRQPVFTVKAQAQPLRLVGDIGALCRQLRFSPRVSFRQGVQAMIAAESDPA